MHEGEQERPQGAHRSLSEILLPRLRLTSGTPTPWPCPLRITRRDPDAMARKSWWRGGRMRVRSVNTTTRRTRRRRLWKRENNQGWTSSSAVQQDNAAAAREWQACAGHASCSIKAGTTACEGCERPARQLHWAARTRNSRIHWSRSAGVSAVKIYSRIYPVANT